ncbi:hypothetical protein Q8A67_000364 [Cirrhinus molitorella]|uniref:Uncharacterized protein n=1 Tax=Cirrhinus molitorella TaxID=172907 RepID=A0AA88QFN6_9TELE|nr:hypothetical protein Q8A67_000364 [Cirrhinus molitorella]
MMESHHTNVTVMTRGELVIAPQYSGSSPGGKISCDCHDCHCVRDVTNERAKDSCEVPRSRRASDELVRTGELEGIPPSADLNQSAKEQSLPSEDFAEIPCSDTTVTSQVETEVEYLSNSPSRAEAPKSQAIGSPIEVPYDTLMQSNHSDASGDEGNSEIVDTGVASGSASIESPAECPVRRSERNRRPPGLFHYPTLGKCNPA